MNRVGGGAAGPEARLCRLGLVHVQGVPSTSGTSEGEWFVNFIDTKE